MAEARAGSWQGLAAQPSVAVVPCPEHSEDK